MQWSPPVVSTDIITGSQTDNREKADRDMDKKSASLVFVEVDLYE